MAVLGSVRILHLISGAIYRRNCKGSEMMKAANKITGRAELNSGRGNRGDTS